MLNTMDFLLPRPNWLWPTLTPNTTPFQGWPASYLVASGLHWTAVITEGQHFVLTRIDTHSGHEFAFPVQNASAKTAICRLKECLMCTILRFHPILPLNKELNSQPNECANGPRIREFPGLTMFPVILKQLDWWNNEMTLWTLKLQHQIGANILQGWGKFFKAIYALNHCVIYGSVSMIARIYGSRNHGRGNESGS
jgi:hypothetical protein